MRVAERPVRAVRFGPFAADLRSGELYKDGARVRFQEQPFKILSMLLRRPGEVVTREELRHELWPDDSLVDFDHNINVAINKIRVALGHGPDGQPFVETVGKRGYRFVQAVERTSARLGAGPMAAHRLAAARHWSVGRATEQSELWAAFHSADAGRGLVVCVTGEAGIGKTTVVEDFLKDLAASGKPHLVGRGRCSERLAGTEAYLPIVGALESLQRSDGGRPVTRLLRSVAPGWYAQVVPMPAERSASADHQQTAPTSQEWMKREAVEFLRKLSQTQPVVLFLDDIHWADTSTVDLLAYIGIALDALHLLIVVTYRPSELFPAKHQFSRIQLDLQSRGACRETPVQFLSRNDIETYLGNEFPKNRFPASLSAVIHGKTEGNALFMVDVVRYLRARQVIAEQEGEWALVEPVPEIERDVPESVRSMILRKIDQLDHADRGLLVGAAAEGYEFESAVVARALGGDAADVEERLLELDHVYGFVRPLGELEFPDGTLTIRYRFVHVLYQNAFYGSLGPTRRVALSKSVAEVLLNFYGNQVGSIAALLAFLFEVAREPWRASEYYVLAVRNAARVFAHAEAIALARRGLNLLHPLPKTPERIERELDLQTALTLAMAMSRGYASRETFAEMSALQTLGEGLGDTLQSFAVWWAIFVYNIVSAHHGTALEMSQRLVAIAEASNDRVLLLGAYMSLGTTLHHQGQLLAAQPHLERAVALHDPSQIGAYAAIYRSDPGLVARAQSIRNLYLIGYPDQALRRMRETVSVARQSADKSRIAFPLAFAVYLHQFLGQAKEARELGDECLAVCHEYGISQEQGWVMAARGWAVAKSGKVDEGIAEIRAALEICARLGSIAGFPHFLAILAETSLDALRIEEGLAAVSDGLAAANMNNDRLYDAQLHWLRGELLLRSGAAVTRAEASFHESMAVARRQGAKAIELRAAASLARIWLRHGRREEVAALMRPVYDWFTEGFDTRDLQNARALLDEVGYGPTVRAKTLVTPS